MGPNQENRGRRGQGVLTSALLTLQAEQFLVCVCGRGAGGGGPVRCRRLSTPLASSNQMPVASSP